MRVAILTTDNREDYRDYRASAPYFGTAPQALLQGFAGLPEVEVHVVACAQQPMPAPEKLGPNIWFHSLHVPKIGWMRTGYQGCIRATRRKLREIQPDIVHGQGTERDCAMNAVFSGFPNVVTLHGHMNAIARVQHAGFGSFHWLAARLEHFTLPRTGGIICISDYIKKQVAQHQVRTWVVPNAVRKLFFEHPRTATGAPERPLLINVGVISELKRQQQLLAMLVALRAEGRQFDTVFVGVADEASPYAQKFVTLLAEANRNHGGFVHVRKPADDELCRLMDGASAMIHFSNEESFGLTFAEAIARGLYLFASDVGAVRFIATGASRVQILDRLDWLGLRSAVSEWLASGGPKQPRPANPPPEFRQSFHPVSVARRHLDIYREVLSTAS